MTLSIELKIPIIVVMQANRNAANDKYGDTNTESPELDTIRGSDGVSHNASKAISVYKAKDMIKLYISKNRDDEKSQKLFYNYDINSGSFTYTANPKDGLNLEQGENSDRDLYKDSSEAI